MPLKSKIGGMVLAVVLMWMVAGCMPSLQVTASPEEFATKEYIEKKRNWHSDHKPASIGNIPATLVSPGASTSAPVVIPLILILSSIPNENRLSIFEMAKVQAVELYDYSPIFSREYLQYRDGAYFVRAFITARSKGKTGDDDFKPMILVFESSDKGKGVLYYEGWIVKKEADGNYYYWTTPLLKRKGDSLVYFFDEALKAEENVTKGRRVWAIRMEFQNSNTKTEDEILPEIREYFLKNKPQMTKVIIEENIKENKSITSQ